MIYADKDLNTNSKQNILLVADPQLIGINNEIALFGPITRKDSDRFLQSGFTRALKYTNADVVVFLGDIFDEGEVASDYQFNSYKTRFENIFLSLLNDKIKVIIVPGDNDIGGETFSDRNINIVSRYMKRFNRTYPYLETLGDINFIAADIRTTEDYRKTVDYLNLHSKQSKFNVLFNHESVQMDLKLFKVKADFHLVVTAHTHLSVYKHCDNCYDGQKIWSQDIKLESYNEINFQKTKSSSKIVEITVPTCSYRMGVPFPGYGYLQLSDEGDISYRVLWLPYRFYCLAFYCAYLVLLFILICSTSRHPRCFRAY